jgi:hypothetical protein
MGTYENIERAWREQPLDTRSAEQRRFEKNGDDVRNLLRSMTRACASPNWMKDARTVADVSLMETELARKLSAVRMDAPVESGGN